MALLQTSLSTTQMTLQEEIEAVGAAICSKVVKQTNLLQVQKKDLYESKMISPVCTTYHLQFICGLDMYYILYSKVLYLRTPNSLWERILRNTLSNQDLLLAALR